MSARGGFRPAARNTTRASWSLRKTRAMALPAALAALAHAQTMPLPAAFARACEAALAEYQSTRITAWGVQHEGARVQGIAWEWSELIKKLHADPRYMAGDPGDT